MGAQVVQFLLVCLLAWVPAWGLADDIYIRPTSHAGEVLQQAIIASNPGDTIHLGPGVFRMSQGLDVRVPRLRIQGAGSHRTVLQYAGAHGNNGLAVGLSLVADGVHIAALSIEDTPSTALAIQGSRTVVVDDVHIQWNDNRPEGVPALVVESSQQVALRRVTLRGGGVFLRGVDNTLVREVQVEGAAVGIGVEQSGRVEISDSVLMDNGVGIVVAVAPALITDPQTQHESAIRIYGNDIHGNNRQSIAHSALGQRGWPRASGIVIAGASRVDIANNRIRDHGSFGVGVMAHQIPGKGWHYPSHIQIWDNDMAGNGQFPDAHRLRDEMRAAGPDLADIYWDGRAPLGELLSLRRRVPPLALALGDKTTFLDADMGWYELFKPLHAPSRNPKKHIMAFQPLPPLPEVVDEP